MESPFNKCHLCDNITHSLIMCACCRRYVCGVHINQCHSKEIFMLGGEIDNPTKRKFKKTVIVLMCDKCLNITHKSCNGNMCTITFQP